MLTINDLVIQLQICRDGSPEGMVPVQAAMYLAVAFGRPLGDVLADKELITCPAYLDHAAFIRTTRRLLPLDEDGSRSGYLGSADREDLRSLLKTFGRDPIEVDDYISADIPEAQVNLNKFLRILAKPIAGQRYSIGVYTVSRPLGGGQPVKLYTPQVQSRTLRKRPSPGMPIPRDSVAMSLARRVKYQKYRTSILRHRARRNSESDATSVSSTDDRDSLDVSKLTMRLCGLSV